MSFHVDELFMSGKPETLKVIKENIKDKFNASESVMIRKFLGLYYKWVHDAKGTYAKMTMEKDPMKLEEAYEKYARSDLRV